MTALHKQRPATHPPGAHTNAMPRPAPDVWMSTSGAERRVQQGGVQTPTGVHTWALQVCTARPREHRGATPHSPHKATRTRRHPSQGPVLCGSWLLRGWAVAWVCPRSEVGRGIRVSSVNSRGCRHACR